ncbi:hypothetical protein [Chitinophaga alhagiae]|uniref:hypothetical protein n=1 Tax=Chitinophaga alhagiae TaxID=2203219 RepID=UPI0013002C78|nr:hypothetical protein [Chitinophaga alhagiae]
MDYSFAPGGTPFDGLLRAFYTRRGNTTLIAATAARNTLREFISHIDGSATVTKPIQDMLLGTHANAQGYLAATMFDNQIGRTGYEVMEDAISGRHTSDSTTPDTTLTSIAIPDTLIGYTTGPVANNFHIKGCNVGRATAFLQKMKEALGDHVNLTAPLHFFGLYQHTAYGIWEFLAYEFKLLSKTAFANRAALVTAFDNLGLTFYNGDPVPVADIETWVPRTITRAATTPLNLPLGISIGSRTTIGTERQFRYPGPEDYTFTINFPNASQVPSTPADRMTALENGLDSFKYRQSDTVGGFDPAHPYPEYERWGYSSKQDFLDEHDWRFEKSGSRLICRGRFHAYTLLVPITDRDPANLGNIIFNFHPNAGSPHAAITTGLVETDTNFFATV